MHTHKHTLAHTLAHASARAQSRTRAHAHAQTLCLVALVLRHTLLMSCPCWPQGRARVPDRQTSRWRLPWLDLSYYVVVVIVFGCFYRLKALLNFSMNHVTSPSKTAGQTLSGEFVDVTICCSFEKAFVCVLRNYPLMHIEARVRVVMTFASYLK